MEFTLVVVNYKQTINLNTEPAVPDITAFRFNTTSNDVEAHEIVNLEPEHMRRTRYSCGYGLINSVVCGRELASPISSMTASGVVSFNNEIINAQKMEYVDMYHVQPDTSNTYKLVTP